MSKDATPTFIAFLSAALPDLDVALLAVRGREELSKLYRLELLLGVEAPLSAEEIDALLVEPCVVALGPERGEQLHGVLASLTVLDGSDGYGARYRAELVPSVSLLEKTRHSRVFQNQSTREVISEVLGDYGFNAGDDFELRLLEPLPKREYVVQYQESDWAFLQRWMEHEGLFYWFEHDAGGERLIIGDSNERVTKLPEPDTLSYRGRNNLATAGEATIWDWSREHRPCVKMVAVLDYNYRTPQLPLVELAEVSPAGVGSVVYYGAHFRSDEEGKRLAEVRAQQLASRRCIVRGRTDCRRFRVGHSFVLDGHHDPQHDGRYLITAVEHEIGRVDGGEPDAYRARFEAIPAAVPFRAERCTPWPKIEGVMHAHVAGEGSGELAELDELGRYKVAMPWNIFGSEDAAASRWVRMAQPSAGAGYGTHFPLHRGAEVLLAHVGGDPDRPLIIAAVPNANTLSPTTHKNASQSVIQTASGIRIEMEDRA